MIITNEAYLKMINSPVVPPETGGIMGSKNGIICEYFFDRGILNSNFAIYSPDINNLNKQILVWESKNIVFSGFSHTHPIGQQTLSDDDIVYIKSIMINMPDNINSLYFPIIIPRLKIFPYIAVWNNNCFSIFKSKLKIIYKEVK